jgi:effector-binding domain-containing protein
MAENCEIKRVPETNILYVRTRTPVEGLPQVLGKWFGGIMQYLSSLGEYPTGEPFVGYFNLDMTNLDIQIGFPVSKAFEGKGEIQPGTIPAGEIAECFHYGSYESVENTYNLLVAFCKEKARETTGVAYEYYYNSPDEVPVEQLKTRVVFPLK